ncbi:hypothetical protein LTR53_014954 [Teratosphaeriaceae sp. CCFEE 6253]|nr:hypothetical protein LTR53_014954 [Teratosphaeriaceae sp. CCFEE 6253]
MAKATDGLTVSDEAFFMAIIEQLGAGNIDWQTVANKCGIVSKGAAGKRFSRLKIKYAQNTGANVNGNASPNKSGATAEEGDETTPAKTIPAKKTPARMTPGKKRKAMEEDLPAEDEESEGGGKRVKTEAADDGEL